MSNPLYLGMLTFALTLLLALAAAWGLHALDAADDPWLMALILSTTSLGLVVPVLKERNLVGQPYGQALLVSAVIADFATMILVSVYVLLRTRGLTAEVMLFLLLFGAFATAYRLARDGAPPASHCGHDGRIGAGHDADQCARRFCHRAVLHRAGTGSGRGDDPGGFLGRRPHLPAFRQRRIRPAPQPGRDRLRIFHPHLFYHGGRKL